MSKYTSEVVSSKVLLPQQCPTVWITRDSDTTGTLAESCELWIARPKRVPVDVEHGAMWLPPDGEHFDQCYLGRYTLAAVREWARTIPATDLERIKVAGVERRLPADELN